MESPPNSATWSENCVLSDDSGLLLTSGSNETATEPNHILGSLINQLADSDCEDKSLSQIDSLDGMSDIICSKNFNTVKKGVHYLECAEGNKESIPIEPPPEFQDKPKPYLYAQLAELLTQDIIDEGIKMYCKTLFNSVLHNTLMHSFIPIPSSSFWSSDFALFGSPASTSKRSLVSSRLSSSHNSLSVPTANKVDDSSFITQAVSHDTLSSSQISDVYNVPFDSDIYSVPKDVVKTVIKPKRLPQHNRRQRRNKSNCDALDPHTACNRQSTATHYNNYDVLKRNSNYGRAATKRHSVAGSSANAECEPVHMTLQEVRHYLQQLSNNSAESAFYKRKEKQSSKLSSSITTTTTTTSGHANALRYSSVNRMYSTNALNANKKNGNLTAINNQQIRQLCQTHKGDKPKSKSGKSKKSSSRAFSIKQAICNIFKFRRFMSSENIKRKCDDAEYGEKIIVMDEEDQRSIITNRALPPLPSTVPFIEDNDEAVDFAKSLQKVKDFFRHDVFTCTTIGASADYFLLIHLLEYYIPRGKCYNYSDFAVTCDLNFIYKKNECLIKYKIRDYRILTPLNCMFKCKIIIIPIFRINDCEFVDLGMLDFFDAPTNLAVTYRQGIFKWQHGGYRKKPHKGSQYGWYWGPISGEAAEKILSNEPDGSFVVRDSSDDHYIFSLTFKLNNSIRHVRIEHFQGNFSFGTCTKFKSQTIVEFIENAVEHSRSGRYLFFLHRRPVMGPVRVQLLNPVSRFKQIQSLQHMCRFVILKIVRRDLVSELPLPRRMVDYLSTPQYYSEHFTESEVSENQLGESPYTLDRNVLNSEHESSDTNLYRRGEIT